MSSDIFVMLYKTLVRSHVDCVNIYYEIVHEAHKIWSPIAYYRRMDIEKIERVQMRVTRMVQRTTLMRLD